SNPRSATCARLRPSCLADTCPSCDVPQHRKVDQIECAAREGSLQQVEVAGPDIYLRGRPLAIFHFKPQRRLCPGLQAILYVRAIDKLALALAFDHGSDV